MIDARTQGIISNTLTLAKQLGAIVFTYKGEDIVRTLLQFAKEYRVGHIVIGSPRPRSLWERIRGKTGIVDRLIHEAKGVTVTVLDTREEDHPRIQTIVLRWKRRRPRHHRFDGTADRLTLPQLISPERIVIWNKPVAKEVVLRTAGREVGKGIGGRDSAETLECHSGA